jgi:hypothetical protein
MTIKVNEDSVAIWFMQITPTSDYLGHLAKTDEPDAFKFVYRFRYYQGDQSLEFEKSEDKKNWYEVILHHSRDKVIETLRELQEEMRKTDGDVPKEDCWELIRGDDESPDQFMERLRELPFSKTQTISLDEAKERGLTDGT